MFRCVETYIGESIRNVEDCWSEHNFTDNKSEPAKHLADKKEHSFCGVFYVLLHAFISWVYLVTEKMLK